VRPARRRAPASRRNRSARPQAKDLETRQTTLLDLADNVLNKGVVVSGDLVLGLADVDLIYLRLSALLCAADRMSPPAHPLAPRPFRS
jgi:hypothetical protein